MDEPIRVETKMTYDDLKRYLWFNLLKRGRGLRPSMIVMIAALALCLLILAAYMPLVGVPYIPQRIWMPILAVFLFIPLYFCIVPLSAMRVYKTSKTHFDTVQVFAFGPDEVRIETTGASVSGTGAYRYDAFHKAFEAKDAFYLYISSQQAHLASKRGMDADAVARVRGLLGEKMGKRFVVCF